MRSSAPLSWKENRFLRGMIYLTTKKLQENGNEMVFHWVPGHAGLIGNEKANLAAKIKAETRGGSQAERWSSLAYVKRNLMQARSTELTRWHERKTQEREASRYGQTVHPLDEKQHQSNTWKRPEEIRIAILPEIFKGN